MRIAVLVSGSGSNLQSLLDASATDPDFGVDIALVVSDRPGVGALDRATDAGVATEVVPWKGDRAAFTRAVCDTVADHGCEAMVLAGFMRILGPEAVARFPERILNIHPSLLPAFPGAHAVPQALAHGVKTSGVTVHFVDEEVDHGPIIAQRSVPVHPDDDEASLHARIQEQEHVVYPQAVKAFARGELSVEGRVVRWSGV
ncbi:MAG: phosphoribosylglycinamide formyltransferase [Acidimicrobiia bacterium]|nr:phosphoribosylglycinamide formyltransferase [Acidimicrobiia bacterium]